MQHKLIPYCNQIIIATLLVIVIAVPLFFDTHFQSVFDLSKITVLYVLTFFILAVWSIKTLITCRQFRHEPSSALPEHTAEGIDNHVPLTHSMPKADSLRRTSAQQLLRQPLSLPILAYLFVSGLATVFSINPYVSLVGTYARYGGLISTIVYISLFFAIINFIDKRRLSLLLNIIILTACIASIYGILQHFGLDFHQWNTHFGHRVPSTFGHPAFFSTFLIMAVPLILIKIFSDSHLRYSTFLYMGILVLLLISFYYTKTRASFLGLIISNLFFFTFIGKKNLLANKIKTIVTITIIIGTSVFFNINNEASEGHEASVIGRLADDINFGPADQLGGTMRMRVYQYLTGLKIIHDYPILGIGPDTLGTIYPQYLSKVFKEKGEHRYLENKKHADRIHNDFLDVTVSRGLLGLGVYVWLIFAYARMVWKGYKKANGYSKILIIGLCAGSLAYFIQNQFSFGHISIITPLWFLIAMSVIACPVRYSLSNGDDSLRYLPSHNNLNTITHETGRIRWVESLSFGKSVKRIFYAIIVCLMILLIILSLFRCKADLYFKHARKLVYKNEPSDAIQSYEMAVKYNPLLLYYRNVLNRIYLEIGISDFSKSQGSLTDDQPDIISREQTTMWITNAIAGAEEVQKLDPEDYHSAFILGQAYHLLDKISPARPVQTARPGGDEDTTKDAIRYYKKAITLRPFMFEFRDKLALLYAEKGQYKDAIYELKEAQYISPDNGETCLNLAKVYMNDNERYEDAEAVLLEFIKKNPDQEVINIYRLLSYSYLKTAKWEKLLKQSEKIIQLEQKDLNAHKYAITANFNLERYNDARNLCNRVLDLSGSQNNTYSKYAKAMLELSSEK